MRCYDMRSRECAHHAQAVVPGEGEDLGWRCDIRITQTKGHRMANPSVVTVLDPREPAPGGVEPPPDPLPTLDDLRAVLLERADLFEDAHAYRAGVEDALAAVSGALEEAAGSSSAAR